jgi:hypothetical protein
MARIAWLDGKHFAGTAARSSGLFAVSCMSRATDALAAVVGLGTPAEAVLLLEVLLNVTSLFNYTNLTLTRWLDRAVMLVLVTPNMDRVRYS